LLDNGLEEILKTLSNKKYISLIGHREFVLEESCKLEKMTFQ